MKEDKTPKKPQNPLGGPKNGPRQTNKRREYIRKQIEKYSYYGLNKSNLATKLNTDIKTITNDIQHIMDHAEIPDVQIIQVNLHKAYERVFKQAWEESQKSGQPIDQRGWAKLLTEVSNDQTKFLEAYGKKDPAEVTIFKEEVYRLLKNERPELIEQLHERLKKRLGKDATE